MRQLENKAIKANDLKAIKETKSLLKKKFPIIEMRIFGSKARGDDTLESDIDLLVLTSKKLTWKQRDKMTDSLYEIQLKYNVVISMLVVPYEEWKNGYVAELPIHDVIEKESVAA